MIENLTGVPLVRVLLNKTGIRMRWRRLTSASHTRGQVSRAPANSGHPDRRGLAHEMRVTEANLGVAARPLFGPDGRTQTPASRWNRRCYAGQSEHRLTADVGDKVLALMKRRWWRNRGRWRWRLLGMPKAFLASRPPPVKRDPPASRGRLGDADGQPFRA